MCIILSCSNKLELPSASELAAASQMAPKSRLKEHYFASCLNGNILVQFLITLRPHSTTPKAGWIKPDWSLNTVFNFFLFGFCSVCFPPGLALFLWLKIKRQDSKWSSDLRHGFSSVCEQFLAMIHTHVDLFRPLSVNGSMIFHLQWKDLWFDFRIKSSTTTCPVCLLDVEHV